jgi:hypothetical protein
MVSQTKKRGGNLKGGYFGLAFCRMLLIKNAFNELRGSMKELSNWHPLSYIELCESCVDCIRQ